MQLSSAAGVSQEERAHYLHRPCAQLERCLPAKVHQHAQPSHWSRQPLCHGKDLRIVHTIIRQSCLRRHSPIFQIHMLCG